MKTPVPILICFLCLLLDVALSLKSWSQTVAPPPPSPTCVACGGKNGYHATSCRYYNPPAGKQAGNGPGTIGTIQLQQLNSLIDLFNMPADNPAVETKQAEARKRALEARQREEDLKRERHEREMKTFKPLPSGGAPMTREERERQNILRQNAGVTWNYGEFGTVLPGEKIPDPLLDHEISGNEKLINDVIDEIESNGGRLAAITGRYILNVKDGVMDYLNDAAYAVTTGNSYVMQETGEFDVKKVVTNALYKTATQTAAKYVENATVTIKSEIKGKSIGILQEATINKAEEYKYFDNLSKAWKQVN